MRWFCLGLFLLLARSALCGPALWSVQGPHATIYLLGSVHALRVGTEWLTPAIERAFRTADECWLEIAVPPDPKEVGTWLATRGFDPRHRLSAELPAAAQEELRALAGDDLGKVEHMRPWLAAAFLTIKTAQRAGYDEASGAEAMLRTRARSSGKSLHGFETVEDQFQVLAESPDEEMLPFLETELTEDREGAARLDRLVELWRAGDADALGTRLNDPLWNASPNLTRRLLTDRNRAFADAIGRMVAGEKTVFVAVGAAHLAGPDGVPALLVGRGVSVFRVE